jgi:phage-related protein
MPSVTSSLSDLVGSIVSAITSIFTGILGLFQHLFNTIFGIIGTLFSAVGTSIAGLAQTFEGLLKFLLSKLPSAASRLVALRHWVDEFQNSNAVAGNILVIGIVLAALFIYSIYQQKGSKPITAKKTA